MNRLPVGSGRVVSLLALSLVTLTPVPGRTEPGTPASMDEAATARVQLAQRHYALGETHYRQGDYVKAMAAFRESHQLSGKPELLYNIGRCQEALGELGPAVASFERYLNESKAKSPNLRRRLQHLQARISAKKTPDVVSVKEGPQPARRWMRPTAWALVGAGAVALGTGIALGVVARSRATDVEQAYAAKREWADVKDTEESGKRLQIGMIVGVVIGAVAVAGGVTLHVLAPRAERRITLSPVIDRRLAGLVAGLRF